MAKAELTASESERLRTKIALVLPTLVGASDTLATHPRIVELYPDYLVTVHAIIRASVPLMETARTQAAKAAATDAVSAALERYFDEHIPEERDHDEWLLEDLEAIGIDRSAVLARPPSRTVAAVVGAQYYWILHYHPAALLGYIAVLEGYPPTPELIEEIRARTGYPSKAFRTLAKHGELDPGHKEELDATIDSLPLTEDQSKVIGVNAMYTVQMLTRALDEVVDRAAAVAS